MHVKEKLGSLQNYPSVMVGKRN